MGETTCYECDPILCDACDRPIYENEAELVCDKHDDTDIDYCSCDDDGCGTCNYDRCQCDMIYDNYKDSLLERD